MEAYRHGLRVIREAIGPDAYLLGCGAPILPSVGLVDAMRVGPDIGHHYEPLDGDLSQPSQRAAAQNSRARAWQHGRFWVNDADCLVAAPHVERREEWARVVEECSGLRASSDRLRELDAWGLEMTRRLLSPGADNALRPLTGTAVADDDEQAARAAAPPPRRPGYHFTVPSGWINDPLGVTWHEGPDGRRYELFYQFNPDAPVWAPACRWGQASSPDLVRWRDPRTALEPGPEETGCWSGSVVVDAGRPVIVYTSVLADAPGMGRIALAEGDAGLAALEPRPHRAGHPRTRPERRVRARPRPFRLAGRGLVADGRRGRQHRGSPSVLQYSSPDLRRWRPDGVLVAPGPGMPGPGGTVWECPQLFPLDGSWVLLVSVWDDVPGGWRTRSGTTTGSGSSPAPGTGWPQSRSTPRRPSRMRPAAAAH